MAKAPRPAGLRRFSGAQWHTQNVLKDSVESSDDEYFDAREEVVEGKSAILIGMSQWNSNDLVEQIETIGKLEENQGEESTFCSYAFLQEKQRELYRTSSRKQKFPAQGSIEIHEDNEEGVQHQNCKTHVLILILHGGNILDTGGGDHSSKLADINTFSSVFEKVTRAHFPAALGHILIRLVPCPAICSAAFSLVSKCVSLVTALEEFWALTPSAIILIQLMRVGTVAGEEASAASSIHSSVLKDGADFPPVNSSLSEVNLGRFEFEVSDFFLFGSPLGLVLAMRSTVLPSLDVCQVRPACSQVYSFFHSADPSACRLEPLLEKRFHLLPPFSVPRYQRYPLGDGRSHQLGDAIHNHSALFLENSSLNIPFSQESPGSPNTADQPQGQTRKLSLASTNSENSGSTESLPSAYLTNITAKWWGTKRIDYALYCPDVLTAFPTVALPHLFHASYWESTDVVAFILRQVMRYENVNFKENDNLDPATLSPSNPREKWLRKRTHVKLRNVTANHRANDVIAAEDGPQVLVGRFMYGPLDMVALTGEKVDIFIMTEPSSGRWVYFDTEISNSSGRISYNIPKQKRLRVGVYPIKMVVRGDQSSAASYLTVLPRGMECVVFSIDGSFAASVSIMGSDPKVRAGAVDVVRHWQDLGYLIIYITGRPDMQKQRVVSWLSQHNFPQGMIFFSDGLVHDPLRQKTIFLRNLMQECHIKICAAYGSMKDISVYNVLALSPSQIYIVGRPTKKYQAQCQFLSEGYAAHLASLEFSLHSRPKKNNSRMILRKGSFGLHSQPEFLRKRNHLRRTMSVQQPDPPSSNPKPERAQSQPESDKDHDRHLPSIAWVRGGVHKFESVP
ncbi:membrane-associated phosphatidylinositol transfer protein 3 isoform X3 [Phalacrocorax aristotelis]|uniref:membrane-associated phosphatidylinositol transfer protein 3 isoform X3 n=1 Tax=Phalacrocorax aristotelis TaxID=126867 RepID=UPI003F4C76AD